MESLDFIKTYACCFRDEHGMAAASLVVGAVIAVVMLAIGAVIAFQITAAVTNDTINSAAFNTTRSALITGTQSAWAIGNLLPLVILAVAIIGAVVGIMSYGRGR